MKLKFIDEIKKLESKPEVKKLFSNKEVGDFLNLYNSLPITTFNKKQNVIKKRWLQNYKKELDDLYTSRLRKILGEISDKSA